MASGSEEATLKGRAARFWKRSYAGEYVGIAIILVIYVIVELFGEPFHQLFSLDDRSKGYPHAQIQRVSELQNIIYAGLIPLAILLAWTILSRPEFHKAHVTILGFLEALLLTSLTTDIIKNAVGRARPDAIARCKPIAGTPAHDLVDIDVCTETDRYLLQDGWRSFPSGHSSFAFAGLFYLALFIGGQMHVLRPTTDLTRFMIFVIPISTAALIAMSRVADYRHDVYDVTAGSVLGLLIAHTMYRRHYRCLRHSKCDMPYPKRRDPGIRRARGKARADEESIDGPQAFELEDTDDESLSETLPLHSVEGSGLGRRE